MITQPNNYQELGKCFGKKYRTIVEEMGIYVVRMSDEKSNSDLYLWRRSDEGSLIGANYRGIKQYLVKAHTHWKATGQVLSISELDKV